MNVAKKLSAAGLLSSHPVFLFPVISTLGFVNGDVVKMMSFILQRNKSELEKQPKRSDGISKKELQARCVLDC